MTPPAAAFPFFPALLLATGLCAQDPVVTLAPAQKGASMIFEQTTVQKQIVTSQGQEMEIAQTLMQAFSIAVVDVEDGGTRTVKVTWSRLHGTVTMPDHEAPFDSAKSDVVAEGLQAGVLELVGKEFTAKIDGDGKVTDIQGLAEPAKSARDACGDPQLAQMLDSFVGDRAVANLVRTATGPLPKTPVPVGHKWQRSEESGNQVPMQRDLTFELRRVDDKMAEMGIAGTITTRAGGRGPMADATVKDGRIEGLALFSRTDGFPLRNETRTQMKIEALGGEMQIDLMITTLLHRNPSKLPTPAPAKTNDKGSDAGK